MTWYDSNYKQRQPIAVDALAGDGSVATKDITITIPKTWDLFWDNIRSDFFDIVPVNVDGDLLSFERAAGANLSTRTLVINIDDVSVKTQAINFIYLYFQNPDQSSDPSSSVTIASAIDGYIDIRICRRRRRNRENIKRNGSNKRYDQSIDDRSTIGHLFDCR